MTDKIVKVCGLCRTNQVFKVDQEQDDWGLSRHDCSGFKDRLVCQTLNRELDDDGFYAEGAPATLDDGTVIFDVAVTRDVQ